MYRPGRSPWAGAPPSTPTGGVTGKPWRGRGSSGYACVICNLLNKNQLSNVTTWRLCDCGASGLGCSQLGVAYATPSTSLVACKSY